MVNLSAPVTDRPTPIVTGATGYGVRRREFIDPPPKTYSQAELRLRRRRHLPVTLGRDFDLPEELRAVLGAIEAKLSEEPCPGTPGYQEAVTAISGAVEELCDRGSGGGNSVPGRPSDPDREQRGRETSARRQVRLTPREGRVGR